MTAASTGAGPSGEVLVQGLASPAQSLFIDGSRSGIFTDAHGTGLGGSISVNANAVTMSNGATISANSAGAADAGSINITANNGLSMQNSSITTEVSASGTGINAGGGNIKITTSPSSSVYLQNSTISASVADGPGGGGNVSIDPQYVILQNGRILAQAADGAGGSISIIAGLFLPDSLSVVNADSGSGLNGSVSIQSPISQAGGKIQPLGKSPLLSTSLVNQRCAALAGGNFSSFTLAGRDSLPAEPSGWLSSPLALQLSEDGDDVLESSGVQKDDVPFLSLRQIAPPGFLTQEFALDGSEGCTS
jgi:large exoprotein involved in heme utilization and adhesion